MNFRVIFKMQEASRAQWDSLMQNLERQAEELAEFLGEVAIDSAHEVVQRTFEGEGQNPEIGSNRWVELAPRTIFERVMEGYGEGPILVRTGELRDSLTDESHPLAVVERTKIGKRYEVKMGTTNPRFDPLQMGAPSSNLPSRPMWPVGASEEAFIRILENRLVRDVTFHMEGRGGALNQPSGPGRSFPLLGSGGP